MKKYEDLEVLFLDSLTQFGVNPKEVVKIEAVREESIGIWFNDHYQPSMIFSVPEHLIDSCIEQFNKLKLRTTIKVLPGGQQNKKKGEQDESRTT